MYALAEQKLYPDDTGTGSEYRYRDVEMMEIRLE
jgi:hypothetical protein